MIQKTDISIDSYYYQILRNIEKTPQYTERLIRLFNTARADSIKIAVAECMESYATEENYVRLFELFENSDIAKLRMEACRIACKFGQKDLLQRYAGDADGHIRKYVNRALHL